MTVAAMNEEIGDIVAGTLFITEWDTFCAEN